MLLISWLRRLSLMAIALVAVFLWQTPLQAQSLNPEELSEAVTQIEQLDGMRSQLASGLEGTNTEPTLETFKQVCKPVGMRAKQLSQETGWTVQQIAEKYRNPNHAPKTESAEFALTLFKENPTLVGYWDEETLNGQQGARYFRRINVEASCQVCHGRKGDRPDFVKNNYPQDLAYDFEVGDLRGLYSVFIPYLD